MKILILQPKIDYRGAENVCVHQCYWLKRLGHEAKIATIFVDLQQLPQLGREVEYVLPPKILSELAQKSNLFLLILGPILLIWSGLKAVKEFEIINAHNPPAVWIAVILGKIFEKTVVWTVHGVPKKVAWKKKRSIFEYLAWRIAASRVDRALARKADLITAVSEKVKGEVERRYQKEAVVIYPGIVKTEGQKSTLPKQVRRLRRECDLLLLHVGNLHQQKGQVLSLEAMVKLNQKRIKAGLILVGEGPDKEKLKMKSKNLPAGKAGLKISDRVFFAGFVPQSKIGAYYQVCDLNLLPSVDESFSATPLEALTHGKPSVVTLDNGVTEVISKFALVTKPEAEDLYRKILDFKKRRGFFEKKAKEGKEFLKKSLDWKRFVNNLVKAIEEIGLKQVPAAIYSERYFRIHHERPVKALREERETRLERAVELAEVTPGMTVLDLGCGGGEFSLKFAELGAEVWGIDYSRVAIQLANKRKRKAAKKLREKVNFKLMNAQSLTFPADFFDRILCIDVFEHIYPQVLERILEEMERVLRPGGLIVVETAPNAFLFLPLSWLAKKILRWEKFEWESYHVNLFHYFKLRRTLEKLSGKVWVDLFNDGREAFSSRTVGVRALPVRMRTLAKIVDFLRENPLAEKIILSTPLKIFFAYDLWGVVRLKKK